MITKKSTAGAKNEQRVIIYQSNHSIVYRSDYPMIVNVQNTKLLVQKLCASEINCILCTVKRHHTPTLK